MREGWTYKKLGELCDILDSQRKPITKDKRESGNIPYYGATGCLDYVKDYIFDEKLVLLGEDGAKWGAGEDSAYIITGKSWVNNHAHALRPKRETVIDELLVYYLNYTNLLSFITGVTVPKLNQEKMRSILIPLPPLSEQKAIVSRLDSAFAHIDALKANAKKQLDDAKALFQKALEKAMEPKEGWAFKKLGDCFCSISNGANIKQIKGASGIPITRIETLSNDRFNRDRMGYADITDISHYSSYILNDGDILMSHINSMKFLGRAVEYSKQDDEIIIHGMNLLRLIPQSGVSSSFLVYQFQTQFFRKQITAISHQSVNQASFNTTNLKGLNLIIPPLSEQQRIVSRLDELSENVKKMEEILEKTIKECNALKQAILREVFE